MTAKKLLGSGAWIIRNNQLARIFNSNDAAILFGYLCDKDSYFESKYEEKGKKFNGWFYSKAEDIHRATICSPHIQRKWFNIFEEIGLIKIKLKGMPAKNYFKINENELNSLMDSRSKAEAHLDVNRVNNKMCTDLIPLSNKNKSIKNKNNNKVFVANAPHVATHNIKSKYVTLHLFDKFWSLYPKRKNASKAKALTAWTKLCNKPLKERPKWKVIKKAIKSQKKSERWSKQSQYIPHHATWLNNNRWLDDASSLNEIDSYDKKNFTYHGGYKVTKKSSKM